MSWYPPQTGCSRACSGAGVGQSRTRSLPIIAESALAIVLLIGAGLPIRTFTALQSVNAGFDPHVRTMDTSLAGSHFDKTAVIADVARQAVEPRGHCRA